MFRILLMTGSLALAGVSAEAATMKAVYKGLVTASNNATGEFGGGSLNGLGYELTFIYDTEAGSVFSSGPYEVGLTTGSSGPDRSPMISASLKINDVTRTITGAYAGYVQLLFPLADCSNCRDSARHAANDFSDDGKGNYFNRFLAGGFFSLFAPVGETLTSEFSVSAPPTVVDGELGSFTFRAGVDGLVTEDAEGTLLFGSLDVSRVDQPPPSVIPLPAAGWLLLAGIGGLAGLRLRRRAA